MKSRDLVNDPVTVLEQALADSKVEHWEEVPDKSEFNLKGSDWKIVPVSITPDGDVMVRLQNAVGGIRLNRFEGRKLQVLYEKLLQAQQDRRVAILTQALQGAKP
jgi:hypothetical protein